MGNDMSPLDSILKETNMHSFDIFSVDDTDKLLSLDLSASDLTHNNANVLWLQRNLFPLLSCGRTNYVWVKIKDYDLKWQWM